MLLKYNLRQCLPSAEDLPDSDDTPVDNQLQHLIPGLKELPENGYIGIINKGNGI